MASNRLSSRWTEITAVIVAVFGVVFLLAASAQAQSLRGSSASLDRQNAQAQAHEFTFLRTPDQVRGFVQSGYLVPVAPNADLEIHQVSFPYVRPEVRVFLERLAAQHRQACGERLVVTSLTRPTLNQPRNASVRSVHPTGMAADLRRPENMNCRRWLESALLALESESVLEVIYERSPPHYHLAVFPRPYSEYLTRVTGRPNLIAEVLADAPIMEARWVTHTVASGESLFAIANRYGAAVPRIRSENGLNGDRLLVGQELRIPVYETVPGSPSAEVQVARAPETDPEPDADAEEATVVTADLSGTGDVVMASSGARTHTVAAGESLWTIGRAYGVSENALRAANGVQGSRIFVGQTLEVPPPGETGESVLQYTVQRGESLWTIAARHGTTVDELRRRNGMDTTRIYAGQVLDVPLRF